MFLKIALIAAIALLVWSAAARPSGAHGRKTVYRVKAYDTLWSIASAHYSGETDGAVWQIEHANHLSSTTISPGQLLVLP
jgi:nucleoid-associated protein YgaU